MLNRLCVLVGKMVWICLWEMWILILFVLLKIFGLESVIVIWLVKGFCSIKFVIVLV